MITIGIVAHWARRERAQLLHDRLNADILSVDEGGLGSVGNHLLVWKQLAYFTQPSTLSWALALEDDAEPIPNFDEQLRAALKAAPGPVVSLYLGRSRPPHWQSCIGSVIARPESWLMAEEMLHGVAIAVRGDMVLPMVDGLRDLRLHNEHVGLHWPVDEMIGFWCRSKKIPIAYAHPSLVDHADIPTVIHERISRHATDQLTRKDTREPRKAWVLGPSDWDSSTAQIPSPGL